MALRGGRPLSLSDLPKTIPVFPLQGVLLLPHGKLPLNIFEPRYLAMTEDALATSDRLIGTFRELNAERGVTLVIVTHDAAVAGATDRVVRLQDGRVIADERRGARAFAEALAGEPVANGHRRVWARLGGLLDRGRSRSTAR